MRIVSWNVNGLRSIINKGFWQWLSQDNADICCLQEIKVSEGTLPPEMRSVPGYHSYFAFAGRPGYSGVSLLTKEQPRELRIGMGIQRFDDEGRVIVADYGSFVLLPTYFPNGGASAERLRYKLDFYDAYIDFLKTLSGRPIVICGDVNTAHQEIDLARPKANEKESGFLPEERAWIDRLLASGFVDAYRLFTKEGGHYTWWDQKTRARERNVGWRIDYFFISEDLVGKVRSCDIHPEVMGSDHCPISLSLFPLTGRGVA